MLWRFQKKMRQLDITWCLQMMWHLFFLFLHKQIVLEMQRFSYLMEFMI